MLEIDILSLATDGYFQSETEVEFSNLRVTSEGYLIETKNNDNFIIIKPPVGGKSSSHSVSSREQIWRDFILKQDEEDILEVIKIFLQCQK